MTTSGDHVPEMSLTWLLDDETSEALLRGDDVDPRLGHLATFARQVRDLGDAPPPPASPGLQALIASGARSRLGTTGGRRMLADTTMTATHRVVRLGFAAKLGLSTAVAAVGIAGAAAAGVLPDRAQSAVRHAVEAVTPVEFTEPGDDHPTNFGGRVSSDATGASDGVNGVDGDVISDEAPGAAHRPADFGAASDGALDRAGETPAASNLPADVPAPATGSAGDPASAPPVGSPTTPTTLPDGSGASGEHGSPAEPSEPAQPSQ